MTTADVVFAKEEKAGIYPDYQEDEGNGTLAHSKKDFLEWHKKGLRQTARILNKD